MSKLLASLLSFLRLAVGPEDESPDPPADAAPDEGGETLDDISDLPEDTAAIDEPAETPRERVARERAEAAERRAEDADRRSREYRPAPSPAPDPDAQREEAQLAAARARNATQAEIEMLQWTHQSNRTLREARTEASAARSEARDLHDQTAFEKLEITQPPIYKRYKSRVEAEVAKLRQNGQSAPRLAILQFLMGQDMLNGKTKQTVKAAPAPAVDRGKMPPARTDVQGRRNVGNEREKRRERLRGTPI